MLVDYFSDNIVRNNYFSFLFAKIFKPSAIIVATYDLCSVLAFFILILNLNSEVCVKKVNLCLNNHKVQLFETDFFFCPYLKFFCESSFWFK